MRKLTAFSFITLNGYFKGANGDISWHRHGAEENEYAVESMKSGNILLFGRVTYEMMAGYWPTPMAMQNDPIVATGMNNTEKIVFSRKMKKADWLNTRIIGDNMIDELIKMKKSPGNDMTLLGSGNILTQLADHGLIDGYEIMVDPVVLGSGATLFNGINKKLDLRLTGTKSFKSGVVLLSYEPMDK